MNTSIEASFFSSENKYPFLHIMRHDTQGFKPKIALPIQDDSNVEGYRSFNFIYKLHAKLHYCTNNV